MEMNCHSSISKHICLLSLMPEGVLILTCFGRKLLKDLLTLRLSEGYCQYTRTRTVNNEIAFAFGDVRQRHKEETTYDCSMV